MEAVSDDPIGDALHEDAEAARAEIRAAGITCPSCGVNMADLPEGHMLILGGGNGGLWGAKCARGSAVTVSADVPMGDAAFGTLKSAANIALYDDFRRREDEAFRKMTGGD
jgi:hypothetical protein